MANKSEESLPDWSDYLEELKAIGDRMLPLTSNPENSRARQETWRVMMAFIAQGFIGYVCADPDYPEFTPWINGAFNVFAPNPDYAYTWAMVSGDGVYRVKGIRGTGRFADFAFWRGVLTIPGSPGGELGTLDLGSLTTDQNGEFEVILSRTCPGNYSGEWREMPLGTSIILLRNAAYDWMRERDTVVTIERLDVPPQRPRLTAQELARRLSILPFWVEAGTKMNYWVINDLRSKGIVNSLKFQDYSKDGGTGGQVYLEGLFDIKDDEALILETDVPSSARYWSFLVANEHWETVDWVNRQSSLNGYQAQLDNDGKFRAVISMRDPQVPNWLDTGGHPFGIIQGRWNHCDSSPMPTLRKVALKDVRAHLPTGTPVVTSSERDTNLRLRREGAQRRRRW